LREKEARMRTNKIKAKIRAGEKAYGLSLTFPSLQMVEIAGNLGFDFVFIEGEHGSFGLGDIEQTCIVADHVGLTPVARVPNIHPSTILRFLDRGVMGITGPHIATKADAEALVKACKFAPRGIRSFFGNRVAGYGPPEDVPAYMAQVNEEVLVNALIEDAEALEILPEILSVEGLDMVSIGHFDLSQSMGYPGRPDDPHVAEAMEKATAQIRASDKKFGRDVMSSVDAVQLVKQGAQEFLREARGG